MEKEELGLVDHLIYEAYKDKPLCSMAVFKREIRTNYGFLPNSFLYRKIINYQIEKYGKQLEIDLGREYNKNFLKGGVKARRNNVILNNRRHIELRRVEKIEKKYR